MESQLSQRSWRPHPMQVHVVRLEPGQDLKASLDAFARAEAIDAGVVLTCVGSLSRAAVRFAAAAEPTVIEGKFEILSLVGTLSPDGSHLHVALADALGATIGGHLKEGSQVHTTAEIAIGVVEGLQFARRPDPRTGYAELTIGE